MYLSRVRSATDPFILVLKCLSKDQVIDQNVQVQVRREIEVSHDVGRADNRLCNCSGGYGVHEPIRCSSRHPNILRLYGWFHDTNRIFLMLELAGGYFILHVSNGVTDSQVGARCSSISWLPVDFLNGGAVG